MPSLFDPIRVGDLDLPNRFIMAPLTRLRGTVDNLPRPELAAEYYAQRAPAGLIITEGTPVDPMGVGYPQVPGIWSSQQVELWKPIVDEVHQAGGRIFAQIWHVGRISHSSYLHGRLPVAPSAIAAPGHVTLVRPLTDHETPHALTTAEVKQVVEQFGHGARNAKAAGFDGVELHGANGYLLDQFLQSGTNQREDEYGGSVENRARLMLECTDAAIAEFGAGRVGMHLAPRSDIHGISDTNRAETFGYAARELGRRNIAFLMAREKLGADSLGPMLKSEFGGVYVMNEDFGLNTANEVLERGDADAVGFGKLFLANPDLPARLKQGAPLNAARPELFYSHEREGLYRLPRARRLSDGAPPRPEPSNVVANDANHRRDFRASLALLYNKAVSTARTMPGGRVPRNSVPRGANGRGLCRWCNLEVPPRRFTFCSAYCVHEWRLRTQPRYLREQVYARDKGLCSLCGTDTNLELRRLRRSRGAKRTEQMAHWGLKTKLRKSLWDADHIVPVSEGGGECDLLNIRTLCLRCHRAATAALRERVRRAKVAAMLAAEAQQCPTDACDS